MSDEKNVILTPAELAKRWGMAVGTLANWRNKGKGPEYIKVGSGNNSKVRYSLAVIEAYEAKNTKNG